MNENSGIREAMRKIMERKGLHYDERLVQNDFIIKSADLEMTARVTYDVETNGEEGISPMTMLVNIELRDIITNRSYFFTDSDAGGNFRAKRMWNEVTSEVIAKLNKLKLLADKI